GQELHRESLDAADNQFWRANSTDATAAVWNVIDVTLARIRHVKRLAETRHLGGGQRSGDQATAPGYKPTTAFILMWMDETIDELEDISNAIKDVFAEFGIEAVRADDVEPLEVITSKILRWIEQSEFIIADLSGERPNVYYEVGYALAKGKRPI